LIWNYHLNIATGLVSNLSFFLIALFSFRLNSKFARRCITRGHWFNKGWWAFCFVNPHMTDKMPALSRSFGGHFFHYLRKTIFSKNINFTSIYVIMSGWIWDWKRFPYHRNITSFSWSLLVNAQMLLYCMRLNANIREAWITFLLILLNQLNYLSDRIHKHYNYLWYL